MAIETTGVAVETLLAEDLVLEGMNVGNMYLSGRTKYVVVAIPLVEDEYVVCIGGVRISLAEQGEGEQHREEEDMAGIVTVV